MKTLYKLSLLCFMFIFFMACSEDDPTEGTNGGATLSAKVDGTGFTSLEATIGAVVNSGVLAVQGSDASGKYIRINITSYNGKGTYKAGDALSNTNLMMYGTVTPIKAWATTFNFGTGTVTITEDTSTHIKGTFSFDGYEAGDKTTKKITEGTFNAPKK